MINAPLSPLTPPAPRGRGRPRAFDMDDALDKAIVVFSERGYHATSISALTAAMGLAQGSVYKAFKDKRAVFVAALARYRAVRGALLDQRIGTARTGRERIHQILSLYAESAVGVAGRRGCLITGCAVELSILDEVIARDVCAALEKSETLLARLIREGQQDGSIPLAVDGPSTARLMLCLLHGIRVIGKTGRSADQMAAVVTRAMALLS